MDQKPRRFLLGAALAGFLWIVLVLLTDWSRTAVLVSGAVALVLAAIFAFLAGGAGSDRGGRRQLDRRDWADLLAALAALTVFAGATTALMLEPVPDSPSGSEPGDRTTTTTTKVETGKGKEDDTASDSTTTVVEEVEKSNPPDDSILGRALDNDVGVIIFRLGIAALAAFIAGLLVQRVLLGKYGVKLPLNLGEFPEITGENAKQAQEDVDSDGKLSDQVKTARERDLGMFADVPEDAPRNPSLELIALRQGLEQSVRRQASALPDVDVKEPLPKLVDAVGDAKGLGSSGRRAIIEVIEMGDHAAAGASVDPNVATWISEQGQYLPGAVSSL